MLVAEVSESNRKLAPARSRSSTSRRAGLRVRGDTERLREAFDNLVSNAVKYSPIGGRIDVSAGARGDEAVSGSPITGRACRRRTTARVFGRFQRLSAKPTGGESSTGLGLSIAKRIIDLHNGRIFVESRGPAGGAVFAIALPLLEETDAE